MATTSPKRWREIEEAFDQADALENAEERRAFLSRLGERDPELQTEVEELLAADSQRPAFLDSAAAEFAAPALDLEHDAAANVRDGELLGPYRLVTEIGRGGMSRVFLAERVEGEFEQRVAVKILSGGALSAADGELRFRAERRILAGLEHPSIARLLDGGTTEGGLPYLVMEFIDGAPVTEFCRAEGLGLAERLRLVVEICAAVDFAHQHLVVHRDLKPSNILVSEDRRVRLLDFGIAKLLEPADLAGGLGSTPMTRTGLYLMTPEYAAPEQIRGDPITTATDVYALGVLLYELLTGGLPHDLERKTPAEVERAICEADPGRPSTRVIEERLPTPPDRWAGRLRGDLDTIVLKALRKEPEHRYASARALAEDLERHLGGLPVSARPATIGYQARKFVRRNPFAVSAAAVLLVALAIFGTVMAWQRDLARSAEREAATINRFLVDGLLASAAPEVAQGRDVSVLDAAARRIEGFFDGQPALEASVRRTLGRLYLSHGELDSAANQLERADRLSRQSLGADHLGTLVGERLLAELDIELGEFESARRRLLDLTARQRAVLGDGHLEVLETEEVLARAELAAGDYAVAEERLLAALAAAALAANQPRVLGVRLALDSRLAEVYVAQRRWPDVERVAAEALSIQRRHLGPNHPDLASSLVALGRAQLRNKHYDRARESLEEALALRRRVLGEDHPETLDSIAQLTRYYRQVQDFDSARRYAELELERSSEVLGEDHPRTLRAFEVRGFIESRSGRHDVALPIYRAAVERHTEVLGAGHPSTIRSLKNLNSYLLRLGKSDEARRAAREIVERSSERLASGDRDPTFLNDFAYYLVTCRPADLRQPERALPLAREAVEATRREWGDALDTLARVHYEHGDLEAAIEIQREVLALPDSVALMDNERRLVEYLEAKGDLEAVERELRINLERRRAAGFSDHPIVGVSHRRLGINFARRGLVEKAEAELRTAVGIFESSTGVDDFQLWRARSELGEILTHLGRFAEAETLLAPAAQALAGRTWFEDSDTQHRAQERLAALASARAAAPSR